MEHRFLAKGVLLMSHCPACTYSVYPLTFTATFPSLCRAIHGDFVGMANDLRRISALQTEFGVFTSLATIRGRGDGSSSSSSSGGGGGGQACLRLLRDRLTGLEDHLHASQVIGSGNFFPNYSRLPSQLSILMFARYCPLPRCTQVPSSSIV